MRIILNQETKKTNIYDKLLIVVIALQIFGVIGGALQPVRIFIILFMPFVLMFFIRNNEISRQYKFERFLFIFWILYGLFSLFWSIIPEQSIKEILYLILNFFSFFTIIVFANKALQPQESIIKGWVLLFLLTIPIALYEFWFDIHLPVAVQNEGMMMNLGFDVINRRFASVTYGNLNGYNTILMYMLPFVFGLLIKKQTKIQDIISWIFISVLSYIVLMNSSRGAVICLLIGFVIFCYYYFKGKKSLFNISLISVVLIYLVSMYSDQLFSVIGSRFESQGFSDEGRSDMLYYAWDAFKNSLFFGIGAGNIMPTLDQVYHLENYAPHNLFLEVGVQYGIVIFLLFIGLLVQLFKKQKENPNNFAKFIVIASLVMFPVSSTIDSGYILGSGVWLFLASLSIIGNKIYNLEK